MMWNEYGYGACMDTWGLGATLSILWWILIIVAVIVFVRWLQKSEYGHTHSEKAVDILKERYAKGEIDKREFEEKKKDLTS